MRKKVKHRFQQLHPNLLKVVLLDLVYRIFFLKLRDLSSVLFLIKLH